MRYINQFSNEPLERELIIVDKTANVYVRENIEQIETEDGEQWQAVEYHAKFVATPNFEITDTLVEQIKAVDYAETAEQVRKKRNALLDESDKNVLPDRDTDKEAWTEYRQKLRDITSQEGFPYDVVFPQMPV